MQITQEVSLRFIVGAGLVLTAVLIAIPATLSNFRKAKSDRERRFLSWTCLLLWSLVLGAVSLVVLLERPYNIVVLGVFLLVFPFTVFRISMSRQQIREEDGSNGAN